MWRRNLAEMHAHHVFVTGATGYLGRPLVTELLARGHTVRGLVRPGAAGRLPTGAGSVVGDALSASSFAAAVPPADTMIHLVGTPRPNPAKAAQFRAVDLASIEATVSAARTGGVRHLVYVSVAHPAPIMHAYIAVRQAGEALVRASGVPATILRPWYVLGPGHRWPCVLLPLYAVLGWLPQTREGAQRLGLVTLKQMLEALVHAVEHPATGVRVLGVPEIRAAVQARFVDVSGNTVANKVLNSLENQAGDHCVDIFVRADGTFGFEECRRDPEDGRGWFPLHRYANQVFDTQDEALAQAKSRVEWLV